MASFLAKRLGLLLLTLFAASVVIFVMMEILPGDPASFMLGFNAEPDTVAALRHTLGLDAPPPRPPRPPAPPPLARCLGWIAGFFSGDFGISYTYRVPVAELVTDRVW